MVLILSESDDQSTSEVIRWLEWYSFPYYRINLEDSIFIEKIDQKNSFFSFTLRVNEKRISYEEITSYWYRRGVLKLKMNLSFCSDFEEINQDILQHLRIEKNELLDYIYYLLDQKKRIGSILWDEVNKLKIIHEASNHGLLIPYSFICSEKQVLLNELNIRESLITKGVGAAVRLTDEDALYGCYTEEIDKDSAESMPDSFFPTLFQEKLEKIFELRIFFLCEDYYPMAIFSQNDKQTSVDFRKYNLDKPNRYVPFKLPTSLLKKLKRLMNSQNLNSGSIDMVYTKKDEFVFLEVNPIGQFGMLSYPCNYNLEEIIAKYLIS